MQTSLTFTAAKRRSPGKGKDAVTKRARVAAPSEIVPASTLAPTTMTRSVHDPQHFYNAAVNFAPEGVVALSVGAAKAYAIVRKTHVVPSDFITNSAYGPRSGTSFEERVLSAFNDNLLVAKRRTKKARAALCTACGEEGATFLTCACRTRAF
jgi:hypothetical protein